jgi:hypothetical protein
MHFLSQFSSFASKLFDGHPTVRIRVGLSHSRPGQREERCSVRNLAGFLVDVPLDTLLARGGIGEVHRGVDTRLRRDPALNAYVGGPSKLYEGSRAQIQGAIDALVKRAIKNGDIRRDLDPFDLLRILSCPLLITDIARLNPDPRSSLYEFRSWNLLGDLKRGPSRKRIPF